MRALCVCQACIVRASSVHCACVKRALCVRHACIVRASSVHCACARRALCVRLHQAYSKLPSSPFCVKRALTMYFAYIKHTQNSLTISSILKTNHHHSITAKPLTSFHYWFITMNKG